MDRFIVWDTHRFPAIQSSREKNHGTVLRRLCGQRLYYVEIVSTSFHRGQILPWLARTPNCLTTLMRSIKSGVIIAMRRSSRPLRSARTHVTTPITTSTKKIKISLKVSTTHNKNIKIRATPFFLCRNFLRS